MEAYYLFNTRITAVIRVLPWAYYRLAPPGPPDFPENLAVPRVPAQSQIYYPDPPQNKKHVKRPPLYYAFGIQGPRVVNPAERNQKNPEFLQRPMAGPRGAGGMGASGPNRPQPDTAE